jgi:hypothetical protein
MTFAVNGSLTFTINKEIYNNPQVHIIQSPLGFLFKRYICDMCEEGAGGGMHPCACQKILHFTLRVSLLYVCMTTILLNLEFSVF